MHVDYSVYLVTDNTPAILGDKDIVDVVRAAVEGGLPYHCPGPAYPQHKLTV